MSEGKQHNTGDWKLDISDAADEAYLVVNQAKVICYVANTWDHEKGEFVTTEEDEANACLIMAAPKLLAALKCFAGHYLDRRECWGDGGDECVCDQCVAWRAIDKAEGR